MAASKGPRTRGNGRQSLNNISAIAPGTSHCYSPVVLTAGVTAREFTQGTDGWRPGATDGSWGAGWPSQWHLLAAGQCKLLAASLARRATEVRIMIIFCPLLVEKFCVLFKHFAQFGSSLPRRWFILPTFKFRPGTLVFSGGVGDILCSHISPARGMRLRKVSDEAFVFSVFSRNSKNTKPLTWRSVSS